MARAGSFHTTPGEPAALEPAACSKLISTSQLVRWSLLSCIMLSATQHIGQNR